jgi:hypothetical protein
MERNFDVRLSPYLNLITQPNLLKARSLGKSGKLYGLIRA